MRITKNKYNQGTANQILLLIACSFIIVGALLYWLPQWDHKSKNNIGKAKALNEQSLVGMGDDFFDMGVKTYDQVRSGEGLYGTMRRLGAAPSDIDLFSRALDRVINLRNLSVGTGLMIESDGIYGQWRDLSEKNKAQAIRAVEIFPKDAKNPGESIYAYIKLGTKEREVVIENILPKIVKQKTVFSGKVSDNLYQSMRNSNVSSQLIGAFTEIFAWQVDFYRETRENDEFYFIAEESYVDGRRHQGGEIYAAEYISGSKNWQAFYFESSNKDIKGFFDHEGKSLRDAFLKSPIKLAQISSRFGMRFHPVQNRMKPHNGVDYGAARGTPISAVASGTVSQAGFNRFNGNFLKIKHRNGYETEYLHASNLAKDIRVGAKIRQGQTVAYVGKTGMATGYHLHFGMKLNGKYINPTAQKAGRAPGLPHKYLAEFKKHITPLTIALNSQKLPKEQKLAQDIN